MKRKLKQKETIFSNRNLNARKCFSLIEILPSTSLFPFLSISSFPFLSFFLFFFFHSSSPNRYFDVHNMGKRFSVSLENPWDTDTWIFLGGCPRLNSRYSVKSRPHVMQFPCLYFVTMNRPQGRSRGLVRQFTNKGK